MAREVMRRQAADNEYLHKDFHGALSAGIQYLDDQYGPEAVRQYLHDFAHTFHAPLRRALREHGLTALATYLRRTYETEGGDITLELTDTELTLKVAACPAVTHMRAHGYPVAALFSETTRTLNEALCEGTGIAAELVEYDEATGRSVQHFRRETS